MAKATLTLPSGTSVVIEGTVEEVQQLLEANSAITAASAKPARKSTKRPQRKSVSGEKRPSSTNQPKVDVSAVVNAIKNSDDWDAIEEKVLNKSSQLGRLLLPLYAAKKYLNLDIGLSSGDIARTTRELSVPLSTSNASKALSGAASKYVIGDAVRKQGNMVRYALHKRGVDYFESLLAAEPDQSQ